MTDSPDTNLDPEGKAQLDKLDKAMNNLQGILQKTRKGSTTSLQVNWIFLQIFATYGLRIPHTRAELQAQLQLTDDEIPTYSWFNSMVESYDSVTTSSSYFMNDVLEKMLALGRALNNFADDNSGKDSEFQAVLGILESDSISDALEIITDLRESAVRAQKLSHEILADLKFYKTSLTKAEASIATVKADVDKDQRTSQATIDKLSGSSKTDGSLKQLEQLLVGDRAEYHEDVIIASTSVTYAWVTWPVPPFPIGLIAAATVAGIFGKKAVDMDDTIDLLEAEIANDTKELARARSVQQTSSLAQGSLSKLIEHLDDALAKTTTVQDALNGSIAGLDYIAQKMRSSLASKDGKDKLKATAVVKVFVRKASEHWSAAKPSLEALVNHTVINVTADKLDVKSFLAEVKKEVANLQH